MSEEEKKAIESFKRYINSQEQKLDDYYRMDEEFYKDEIEQLELSLKLLRTVLNLIENQQKELNSLKEIEQLHKEENGKLRVELEQVERKVEEYRIGWCNTGEELEQEKLKNKDMKSAVEYLKKIEPEKLKIIADSWNDKVAHKFDTEIKELTQKAFEDGQESIVKRYISKNKIKDMMKYREFELQQEYKEFEKDVEWRTYKKILEEK